VTSRPSIARLVETSNARHRWTALWVLSASQLMVILDGSIVAVALPAIGRDLEVTGPTLAWVVNAYLVPFGGLLLLAGRLGDLLGRRRILLIGLAIFTLASLVCGLSPDPGVLVAARFVQGVGGALASAVVLGMVVALFPEADQRGRALGVVAFVGAAGSSIGLLTGGLLTNSLGWASIFLVNVPLGVAAILGVRRLVPTLPGSRGRADVPGAVLVTGGLVLVVHLLLGGAGADDGPGSVATIALAVVAAVLLVAFLLRQSRAAAPLLPLRLLVDRGTGAGNLVQALMVAGLFGYQFLGVLYLQQLLGYDPLQAGLAFLPVPVIIAAVSLLLTGRLLARTGARSVLATGLVSVTAGLAVLRWVPAADGYWTVVLPAGLLIAVGFGLAAPALASIAVGGAPPADQGVASGLFNTSQQVGGAIGLALMTGIAADAGASPSLGGYQDAFTLAAALATGALLVTMALPTSAAARS
jgi:EmrB/QacA subfamily drug resistance transporter